MVGVSQDIATSMYPLGGGGLKSLVTQYMMNIFGMIYVLTVQFLFMYVIISYYMYYLS